MHLKNKFISNSSGATLAVVALMLPLLLMVLAVTVDIARFYAVQSKAQLASDAALLGAVATQNTAPIDTEMLSLFRANYPENYLGSTVSPIQVDTVAEGVWEAQFTVTVPTVVMGYFGKTSGTFNIVSQVTGGFITTPRKLELALVLDNTGSMGQALSNGGTKMAALQQAAAKMIQILFGDSPTLNNLHVSLVPYDIVVQIGANHADWMQPPSAVKYNGIASGQFTPDNKPRGFAFNRFTDYLCGPYVGPTVCTPAHCTTCPEPNLPVCTTCPEPNLPVCHTCPEPNLPVCWQSCDPETGACTTGCSTCTPFCTTCTPSCTTCTPQCFPESCSTPTNYTCVPNGLRDDSDDPPTTDSARFRLPYENYLTENPNAGPGTVQDHKWIVNLAPMLFGSNTKADLLSAVGVMTISGDTRINVGLMWGWFTLSPKWQGLWDAGKPDLPAPFDAATLDKAIVLMTDGQNIFPGDDDRTKALCDRIKEQGIVIYTVGLGNPGQLNEPLLKYCASKAPFYFNAPTAEELQRVFRTISDNILQNTERLTK